MMNALLLLLLMLVSIHSGAFITMLHVRMKLMFNVF